MKLSVVIVNYRTPGETLACLKSLAVDTPAETEFIVVENGSGDDSAERIRAGFPDAKLIESPKNLGFAGGCALGVKQARGEYLAFINSDCEAKPGALKKLVEYLDQNAEAAAAVPRLLETDGQVQNNVARLPTPGSVASEYLLGRHSAWYQDLASWSKPARIEAFSGAALMIRRVDYEAAGGFDERYFMYVEDVELSFNLRESGKKVYYLLGAVLVHHAGGSSAAERPKLNKMLHAHRIDYIKRHFRFGGRLVALSAMRLGLLIASLKHAVKTFFGSGSYRQR